MSTKHDRMVTYLDGLMAIRSHDPLITWSCKRLSDKLIRVTMTACGHLRSGNKLETFYLHYRNTYGH